MYGAAGALYELADVPDAKVGDRLVLSRLIAPLLRRSALEASNREDPFRYVAFWGCPVRPKLFVDD